MSQNIAEFRIIGRIGKIDQKDKVTHVDLAANYNRKDGDEWTSETYWNRVTGFSRTAERIGRASVGDLVHAPGRVRQSSYEKNGETVYTVELLADSFAVLASPKEVREAEAVE